MTWLSVIPICISLAALLVSIYFNPQTQHLKDYAIAHKIQPDRETGLLINLITDLEGKYKRKFAAIGSRTIRIISRENDLSQIKTGLLFSDNVSRR